MAAAQNATEDNSAGGRPTDYDPSYVEQAEKLCHFGATDEEMAEFWGVDVRTVYRWKVRYPEFCQAIKSGKEHADERVERSLYQKATGYDYTEEQAIKVKIEQHKEEVEVVSVTKHAPSDTTAAIFWLKNRRKDDWRDKQEHEVTGKDGKDLMPDKDPRQVARAILAVLGQAKLEEAEE